MENRFNIEVKHLNAWYNSSLWPKLRKMKLSFPSRFGEEFNKLDKGEKSKYQGAVLFVGKTPVGLSLFYTTEEKYTVFMVYIKRAFRRKGLGRKLYNFVQDRENSKDMIVFRWDNTSSCFYNKLQKEDNKIIYRTYKKNHPLIDGFSSRLEEDIQKFLNRIGLKDTYCDEAVVAYHRGKIVGFLRYDRFIEELHAAGTWVHKRYRYQGIANKLWSKALNNSKVKNVVVITTSRPGRKLVNKLKKRYKDLQWEHDYVGR